MAASNVTMPLQGATSNLCAVNAPIGRLAATSAARLRQREVEIDALRSVVAKPEIDPIDRLPRHEHDRAAVVIERRAIVRGVVPEISSLVFECGQAIHASRHGERE